jgi:hypothetical protein
MSNPDRGDSSFTYAAPTGAIILIITIVIFMFLAPSPYFNYILYLGIPILVYISTVIVNIIGQQLSCNSIDVGKAFLYGLPSIGLTYLGLGVSYFSWCRMPVVSILSPLVMNENDNKMRNNSSNSKNCCGQRLTLERVEGTVPSVKGVAYGFYLFFTTMFGVIIGNGFSAVC